MIPLLVLADHAVGWRSAPLTPEVEHAARRALIDWFAALLPGCHLPPATLMARALAGERGAGNAVSYVDGARTGLRHAALINGTASHTVEFDDIWRWGVYHPGCPTVAAALAAAQAHRTDMAALLRAMTAGYEVSCRIAQAVQPSHYDFWHTTGMSAPSARPPPWLSCWIATQRRRPMPSPPPPPWRAACSRPSAAMG